MCLLHPLQIYYIYFAFQASTITRVHITGEVVELSSDASTSSTWLISSHALFFIAYFPYFDEIRRRLMRSPSCLCVLPNALKSEESAIARQWLGNIFHRSAGQRSSFYCQFIHHKFYMDFSGIEPRPQMSAAVLLRSAKAAIAASLNTRGH
jgi:hypothetical protein